MKDSQDAMGHQYYDFLTGKVKGRFEVIEYKDGFCNYSGGPECYFRTYDEWPSHEQKAMEYVVGKVLDIGCGAGRHALYLQEQGFDVLGIDISPLAIQVCRERGLKKTKVLSIDDIDEGLEQFDTILMLGNNFGLFGTLFRAKQLLKKFLSITTPRARLIVMVHNVDRQVRVRIWYKTYVTPWFDWLSVSKSGMEKLLEGTGWTPKTFLFPEEDKNYITVIEKA